MCFFFIYKDLKIWQVFLDFPKIFPLELLAIKTCKGNNKNFTITAKTAFYDVFDNIMKGKVCVTGHIMLLNG